MPDHIKLQYPLGRVKEIVHKWLYLEDDRVVDIIIAAHIANQFTTDPTWLLVIGPPSHTKTELLRAFEGHRDAYFVSSLTPATLVSGILPRGKLPDPSLLLKLDGKTVVLKDFTSILAMRSENQQEILSQLREIYDGQYTKAFGNGKVINWKGHVGLLGACTPVYDKHYSVIGSLGDRFLLYRTGNHDGEEMGLRAQKIVGKESQMREEIQTAFHTFIDQFTTLDSIHFEQDEKTNHMIVSLACFCAYGRCPVDRNYRDRSIEYEPMPEGTPRVVKQFMQIGMALALIHGKDRIDGEVYEIVKKIGRDLLPGRRLRILEYLWENKVVEHLMEWKTTLQVAEALKIPGATTKMACEDMMVVGMLERARAGDADNAPYKWQINQRMYDFIQAGEVFDVTSNETF